MNWANTRRSEMVLAVAAVVAMAACGPSSQEHGHYGAHDSTSELRNVIPAAAAAILEQADHFELLSLNPQYPCEAAEGDYHGYRVLGTAVITDAKTRKKLVSAFKRAVAENQDYIAACFNPRHGIRVTRIEKQEDFAICFQCAQVEVFGEVYTRLLISNSAGALFDSVLRDKGIPRAERQEYRRVISLGAIPQTEIYDLRNLLQQASTSLQRWNHIERWLYWNAAR